LSISHGASVIDDDFNFFFGETNGDGAAETARLRSRELFYRLIPDTCFLSTLKNSISKIKFQLVDYNYPDYINLILKGQSSNL